MENGMDIERICAILFSRHCHCAIIFCFSDTAMCATFLSSFQWRDGGVAVALKVAQVPSTDQYSAQLTITCPRFIKYLVVKTIYF